MNISFDTKLVAIGDWTIAMLPKDESLKLSSRGQVAVKGMINGFKFHTPIEPDGRASHWLNVDKEMQKSAGVKAGDSVKIEMESTKDWPEVIIPSDFQKAIDAHKEASELWPKITTMARWEWLRWIGSTNSTETRAKRIEVSCSKMKSGMRRPCCFNRSMCCVPEVSKNGVLKALITA